MLHKPWFVYLTLFPLLFYFCYKISCRVSSLVQLPASIVVKVLQVDKTSFNSPSSTDILCRPSHTHRLPRVYPYETCSVHKHRTPGISRRTLILKTRMCPDRQDQFLSGLHLALSKFSDSRYRKKGFWSRYSRLFGSIPQ